MAGNLLKEPVHTLKGIGQARALMFKRLNIHTILDLITYFPRDYEDRSRLKNITQLVDGETCSFEGVIAAPVSESRPRRGLSIQKVLVRDSTGLIAATWFNQSYLKKLFKPGDQYMFYGRISKKYKTPEIQNPVYEKAGSKELKNTCRIVPVYPSTANLTQNMIRSAIRAALEFASGKVEETLPQWLRSKYSLSGTNDSLRSIHFPGSDEDFRDARYRLAFEELLLLQLGLMIIRNSLDETSGGIRFGYREEVRKFAESLPFRLTGAQERVFHEVERDMESPRVMNRLIQGDVGSGKTVVAVLALLKAVRSGYQGALMVPTEILAEQHYKTVRTLLQGCGVRIALLTGSLAKGRKNEVCESIRTGNADIVIGTHALIEEGVKFNRLGLVVTDEQHRFGVRQRAILSQKGENPDVLVMTATPIPRTLALILYGDLDISMIDELPPGRKPVETYAVDESMRERVNRFIRKKAAEGRQIFIVCPLVEESDHVEAGSAVEVAERIATKDFQDLNVGLIHGRMKPKEKESIMNEFVEGRIHVLVSTTVIEVGVNVPNATVMVIENAERFGLAQLHQLRGRVGRGEHQSYCILYNQGSTDIAGERMDVLQKTNDGFIIAEKDMLLRGPGEFFGTRQHGIPDLKIANLYKDMDILKKAQEAAAEILAADRLLAAADHAGLRTMVMEKFGHKLEEFSMN